MHLHETIAHLRAQNHGSRYCPHGPDERLRVG
jgi:hypothetical protein